MNSKFHPITAPYLWILILQPSLSSEEIVPLGDLGERGAVFSFSSDPTHGGTEIGGRLGDLDGDGFHDCAVRTYFNPNGGQQRIETYILFGRPGLSGFVALDGDLPRNLRIQSRSGARTYVSPDLMRGNGRIGAQAQVIYGVPSRYRLPGYSNGGAFVIHGGAHLGELGELFLEDIGSRIPGRVFVSSSPRHVDVGGSACILPDFNGDGIQDYVISSGREYEGEVPPGEYSSGHVFIVYGSPTLPTMVDLSLVGSSIAGLAIRGPSTRGTRSGVRTLSNFGWFMEPAGDVNGDGLSDLLLEDHINVFLIYGRNTSEVLFLEDDRDDFGAFGMVSFLAPSEDLRLFTGDYTGLGDLNGDGIDDFGLGLVEGSTPFLSTAGVGYVCIFYGGDPLPSLVKLGPDPPPEADVVIWAPQAPDRFGRGFHGIGDVNGDGTPDFTLGASGDEREFIVYALYGKKDIPERIDLTAGYDGLFLRGESPNAWLGRSITPVGDFNGDGVDDFLLEAPYSFPINTVSARLYLIYGRADGPSPLKITAVEPSWGSLRGGDLVRLRGAGFDGDVQVTFGATPALNPRIASPWTVEVRVPPGSIPGPVDVQMRKGAEMALRPLGYEYVPNAPQYRLDSLGASGLLLEGDPFSEVSFRGLGGYGPSVAAFIDLDGDGIDELAAQSTSPDTGWLVTVVRGGRDLPPLLPAYGPAEGLSVIRTEALRTPGPGCSVARLADVDGDGLDDLAIGAWGGRGFILFGRKDPLDPEVLLEDEIAAGRACRIELGGAPGSPLQFAPLRDFDGDGTAAFALAFTDGAGEMRIVEFPGALDPLITDLSPWTRSRILGTDPARPIGWEVHAVGDVNGDGEEDLLVGTLADRTGGLGFLVLGGELPEAMTTGDLAPLGKGMEIRLDEGFSSIRATQFSEVGDVNGDGLADLLLGNAGGGLLVNQGITYLIPGSRDLPGLLHLRETPSEADGIIRIFGEGSFQQAGVVGSAGDFNSDGLSDFLIGQPSASGGSDPGDVFVVYGSRELPSRIELNNLRSRGLPIRGVNYPGGAGFSVGPHGDLNGDGLDDFVFFEAPFPGRGRTNGYVIFGPYGDKGFVRGEFNGDGQVDISDALALLTYLFLGGGASPVCLDAGDVDDGGSLELTDAVALLLHLFLGGPSPAAPYPARGPDPTSDSLGCLGF